MSILSNVTGIGINPFGKRKFKIDPLKALGTAATVASFGGAGPIVGALSHIPGGAAAIEGATKLGAAARALPGASKVGAAIGIGKRLMGGGGGGVPQVTRGGIPISLSDINSNIPAPASPNGGGGGILDYAKSHIGDIATGGIAALDAANAARASKRQGQLSDEALQMAKQRWESGAGLRAAGTAGLMKPVDFGAVYGDPTNPFAQPPAPQAVPGKLPLPRPRLLTRGASA